jgi:hypothetical protein
MADAVRGDDSQDGGKDRPWKTIKHALEQVAPQRDELSPIAQSLLE